MNNKEELKKIILDEYKKGNIVFMSPEGLKTCKLKEFADQPIEGLLYDLNRDEATILTFIDEAKWINDFACAKVIRELKKRLNSYENISI